MLPTTDVCFYHSVCREGTGDPLLTRALSWNDTRLAQHDELYYKTLHVDCEKIFDIFLVTLHKAFTCSSMKTIDQKQWSELPNLKSEANTEVP